MKDINITILEVINHIISQHPNLAPSVEKITQKIQGKNSSDTRFLLELNKEILSKSKSELRQDIFVLNELNYQKDGYFIEFGGANGVDSSNSYLLETEYNWRGILVEPAKKWHKELFENRKCIIDTRCVWSASNNKLVFNQTDMGGLSTIDEFSCSDHHASARKDGERYMVDTISLVDLLDEYNAPRIIDYLSIDTEGSEYEILNAFDFNKYKFKIITCEHNYTGSRAKINELLSSRGYIRKYENISDWDDWYVLKND